MRCPKCDYRFDDNEAICPVCGEVGTDGTSRDSATSSATSSATDSGPFRQNYWQRKGYGPAAVPWRGGEVSLSILLVGMAFVLVSLTTLLIEKLEFGLALGAWSGSHAIGLAILAVVWCLGRNRADRKPFSLSALGLVQPRVSWLSSILLAFLALGVSLGATGLYAWLIAALGLEILLPPDLPGDVVFPGIAVLLSFEALAGWTPLTEEIFFRGFVFAGLTPRLGIFPAAVASALIFAAFHLHPGVLFPIFLTGILLAGLYWYTGSLWPAILAHAGQNAVAVTAIIYGG